MNPTQQQRLAHSINQLRPDWLISSLSTFIERHMSKWAYRDAAVALTWVAVDTKPDGTPASNKPGRVLEYGPWHRAVIVDDPASQAVIAPKRHEQCRDCGRSLDGCLCESGPTPYGSKPNLGNAKAGAEACRDAMQAAMNR